MTVTAASVVPKEADKKEEAPAAEKGEETKDERTPEEKKEEKIQENKKKRQAKQACRNFMRGEECPPAECPYMHACMYCKSTDHGSLQETACEKAKEKAKENPNRFLTKAQRECQFFRKGIECKSDPCEYKHACRNCESTEHGSNSDDCPKKEEAKKEQAARKKARAALKCKICDVQCHNQTMLDGHIAGKVHAKIVAAKEKAKEKLQQDKDKAKGKKRKAGNGTTKAAKKNKNAQTSPKKAAKKVEYTVEEQEKMIARSKKFNTPLPPGVSTPEELEKLKTRLARFTAASTETPAATTTEAAAETKATAETTEVKA